MPTDIPVTPDEDKYAKTPISTARSLGETTGYTFLFLGALIATVLTVGYYGKKFLQAGDEVTSRQIASAYAGYERPASPAMPVFFPSNDRQ